MLHRLCVQVLSCAESSSSSFLDLAASQPPSVRRKCGGERPPGLTCGDSSPFPRCAAAASPAGRVASRQAPECREPHSKSNRGCLRCRCRSQDIRRRRCERCDDAGVESGCTAASFERYVADHTTAKTSSFIKSK